MEVRKTEDTTSPTKLNTSTEVANFLQQSSQEAVSIRPQLLSPSSDQPTCKSFLACSESLGTRMPSPDAVTASDVSITSLLEAAAAPSPDCEFLTDIEQTPLKTEPTCRSSIKALQEVTTASSVSQSTPGSSAEAPREIILVPLPNENNSTRLKIKRTAEEKTPLPPNKKSYSISSPSLRKGAVRPLSDLNEPSRDNRAQTSLISPKVDTPVKSSSIVEEDNVSGKVAEESLQESTENPLTLITEPIIDVVSSESLNDTEKRANEIIRLQEEMKSSTFKQEIIIKTAPPEEELSSVELSHQQCSQAQMAIQKRTFKRKMSEEREDLATEDLDMNENNERLKIIPVLLLPAPCLESNSLTIVSEPVNKVRLITLPLQPDPLVESSIIEEHTQVDSVALTSELRSELPSSTSIEKESLSGLRVPSSNAKSLNLSRTLPSERQLDKQDQLPQDRTVPLPTHPLPASQISSPLRHSRNLLSAVSSFSIENDENNQGVNILSGVQNSTSNMISSLDETSTFCSTSILQTSTEFQSPLSSSDKLGLSVPKPPQADMLKNIHKHTQTELSNTAVPINLGGVNKPLDLTIKTRTLLSKAAECITIDSSRSIVSVEQKSSENTSASTSKAFQQEMPQNQLVCEDFISISTSSSSSSQRSLSQEPKMIPTSNEKPKASQQEMSQNHYVCEDVFSISSSSSSSPQQPVSQKSKMIAISNEKQKATQQEMPQNQLVCEDVISISSSSSSSPQRPVSQKSKMIATSNKNPKANHQEMPQNQLVCDEIINISSSSSSYSSSQRSISQESLKIATYNKKNTTDQHDSSNSSSSSNSMPSQLELLQSSSRLPPTMVPVMHTKSLTELCNSQQDTRNLRANKDKPQIFTPTQKNIQQSKAESSIEIIEVSDRISQSLSSSNTQSRRRSWSNLSTSPSQAETPSKVMKNTTGKIINSFNSIQQVQSSSSQGLCPATSHHLRAESLSRDIGADTLEPRNLQLGIFEISGRYLQPRSPPRVIEIQSFDSKTTSPICPVFPQPAPRALEMPSLFRLGSSHTMSASPPQEPLVRSQRDAQVIQAPTIQNINTQSRTLRSIPSLVRITTEQPGSAENHFQSMICLTPQPHLTHELIQKFLSTLPKPTSDDTVGDLPVHLPGYTPRQVYWPGLVRKFLQTLPESLPPPPLVAPLFYTDENTLNILENEFSKLSLPREPEMRNEFPVPFRLAPLQFDLAGEAAEEDGADERQHFIYSREDVDRFRNLWFLQPSMSLLRQLGRGSVEGLRMYVLLIMFIILFLAVLSICGYVGNIFAGLLLDLINFYNI